MTRSPASSLDRRVQRTREALRQALIARLVEQDWNEISVQDLCTAANLGRSTFYMHFQNKEQLLESGFQDLRAFLRQGAQASDPQATRPFAFVLGLAEHVEENRRLFRAIVGRGSSHVVQVRFLDMVVQLVAEELDRGPRTGWRDEALVRCLAGALVALLSWWVDGRGRSPKEIADYFEALAASLASAAPPPAR